MHRHEQRPVSVYGRLRPFLSDESTETTIHVQRKHNQINLETHYNPVKQFSFHDVFDENTTNDDLYQRVGEKLVHQCTLEQMRSACVCYGQTNSGKTYTWDGLMKRCSQGMFDLIHSETKEDGESRYEVFASCLELYNDTLTDLLSCQMAPPASMMSGKQNSSAWSSRSTTPNSNSHRSTPAQSRSNSPALRWNKSTSTTAATSASLRGSRPTTPTTGSTSPPPSLQIKENLTIDGISSGFYVPNLSLQCCRDEADVIQLMELANSNRVIALTNMNSASSRSHLLFTLYVVRKTRTINGMECSSGPEESHIRTCGKLCFVDLAGSERISRTKVSGIQQIEAQSINTSLAALGNVIHALGPAISHKDGDGGGKRCPHIPYRDSKLTLLLHDFLNLSGDSHTSLILALAPSRVDAPETTSVLQFGQRAMCIPVRTLSPTISNIRTQNQQQNISSNDHAKKEIEEDQVQEKRMEDLLHRERQHYMDDMHEIQKQYQNVLQKAESDLVEEKQRNENIQSQLCEVKNQCRQFQQDNAKMKTAQEAKDLKLTALERDNAHLHERFSILQHENEEIKRECACYQERFQEQRQLHEELVASIQSMEVEKKNKAIMQKDQCSREGSGQYSDWAPVRDELENNVTEQQREDCHSVARGSNKGGMEPPHAQQLLSTTQTAFFLRAEISRRTQAVEILEGKLNSLRKELKQALQENQITTSRFQQIISQKDLQLQEMENEKESFQLARKEEGNNLEEIRNERDEWMARYRTLTVKSQALEAANSELAKECAGMRLIQQRNEGNNPSTSTSSMVVRNARAALGNQNQQQMNVQNSTEKKRKEEREDMEQQLPVAGAHCNEDSLTKWKSDIFRRFTQNLNQI